MIVTDKKYYMDDMYKSKLDLMVKRLKGTDDAILVIDGGEGQGKTEMAFGTCYYMSYETGRDYGIDNIYFDLDKLIKDAVSTKGKIFHYDEAALGLQNTDWQNKIQKKFNTLVMIARKKKHFIVLCIPKFHRLTQYQIEERSIGLVHVYSKNNTQKGLFCYFTKKKKELLYTDWKRTRVKKYNEYLSFWGRFHIASKRIFTKEQIEEYERKKDEAILSLGDEDKTKISNQSKKWLTQRDQLIKYIKDKMNLKYTELFKELKEAGVKDFSMEGLRHAYRSHDYKIS